MVESEVRERIEEAVDRVSLQVLVEQRRAQGRAQPRADSPHDRDEFQAGVRVFLERLRAEIAPSLPPDRRRRLDEASGRPGADPTARLVAVQVVLARELPDYWQRFEAVRTAYTAGRIASGSQGRGGLLRRLLGG
jgi:hypothetical protein